jgi:hypothetical protein
LFEHFLKRLAILNIGIEVLNAIDVNAFGACEKEFRPGDDIFFGERF